MRRVATKLTVDVCGGIECPDILMVVIFFSDPVSDCSPRLRAPGDLGLKISSVALTALNICKTSKTKVIDGNKQIETDSLVPPWTWLMPRLSAWPSLVGLALRGRLGLAHLALP